MSAAPTCYRCASMRALVACALLLTACGAPARPASPRVVVIRALHGAESASRPSLDVQLVAARATMIEGAVLDEQRGHIDGEARMHLVLQHGRCYRVWVGADGEIEARLEDEHGHAVTRGVGWLSEICPRWSGSFRLVVAPRDHGARTFAILLSARPLAR